MLDSNKSAELQAQDRILKFAISILRLALILFRQRTTDRGADQVAHILQIEQFLFGAVRKVGKFNN